jgi:hypothetical protein
MPSFASGMFVTFKLSLIPEFIGDLKELFMQPLFYGIAFSLKKFSDTRKHCSWDDLHRSNFVSTDILFNYVIYFTVYFIIFINLYYSH